MSQGEEPLRVSAGQVDTWGSIQSATYWPNLIRISVKNQVLYQSLQKVKSLLKFLLFKIVFAKAQFDLKQNQTYAIS